MKKTAKKRTKKVAPLVVKPTVGEKRLLKLADKLDVTDKEHEAADEKSYEQNRFEHIKPLDEITEGIYAHCCTPACALGHYGYYFGSRSKYLKWSAYGGLHTTDGLGFCAAAQKEFGIALHEDDELFGMGGCGGAKTGKEAARYIRRFVAKRQKARARTPLKAAKARPRLYP